MFVPAVTCASLINVSRLFEFHNSKCGFRTTKLCLNGFSFFYCSFFYCSFPTKPVKSLNQIKFDAICKILIK